MDDLFTRNAKPEGQESALNTKPEDMESAQNAKPEGLESAQNAKPEGQESAQNDKPEGQESTQNAKPEGQESAQNDKPEGQESTQNAKPEGQESAPNAKPEDQESTPNAKPEGQESAQNAKPKGLKSAQNDKPKGLESAQNDKPKGQESAQNDKPEGQESAQNDKPKGLESAQNDKPKGLESAQNAKPEDLKSAQNDKLESQKSPWSDKPEGQEVWVSRDPKGDLVLLHRVALDTDSPPEARQALLQAARATASFRHPQILGVRDVRLEGDSLVFVQDHPQGPLLADTLAQGGRVPLMEALKWMHQFAHALEAAQASGLTLSQISPTEFVIQETAAPGAAGGLLCLCPPVPAGWWLEVEDPVFASPEQKAGKACDIRSTMYSTGAVLGVMMTGQRPLSAEGWTDVLSTAKLPQKVNKALKAVLDADPRKRCANPDEWMALLEAAMAASPSPGKSHAVTSPAGRTAPKTDLAAAFTQSGKSIFVTPAGNKTRRSPLPLWAATVVILAVGTWLLLTKKAPLPGVAPAETAHPAPAVSHSPPADAARSETAAPIKTPSTTTRKETPQAPQTTAPIPAPSTTTSKATPPVAQTPAPPRLPSAPTSNESPLPPQSPAPHATPKKLVAAPPPAAAPQAGPKPPVIVPPPVSKETSQPAVPTSPEPPKLEAKAGSTTKPAVMPPAAVVPEAKPQPPSAVPAAPPQPAKADIKPKPPSKDELLRQAAQATGAARSELYRKVLAEDSRNTQAIHGLVEDTLSELPPKGAERDELTLWANELVSVDDPLGSHALGCIALQQSADAHDLTAAIKDLSDALTKFKSSLHSGYSGSYVSLVQSYINLHSVQLKNREKPKADRTSRTVLDEIDHMPDIVPAKDSRDLAVRLENQMKEHAAKSPSRMQEIFLKTVIQHLYSTAAKRGDAPSKEWMKK